MPSRPMFTTPERSDQRPPSPAMPIGTARARAAPAVPLEVRSSAPVITRVMLSRRTRPAIETIASSRPGRRQPTAQA